MLKKTVLSTLLGVSCAAFAGLIDRGDYSGFPNVNVDAFLTAIARKHFPEIRKPLPQGLSRGEAWKKDLNEAAQKLDIAPQQLTRLLEYVLHPSSAVPVKAPHPQLLEFELYASGKREFFYKDYKKYPPSWEKLLKLPVSSRKYTTVPVLYSTYFHQSFRGGLISEKLEYSRLIHESIAQGCLDTQGCLLALIRDVGRAPLKGPDEGLTLKLLFRKFFANYEPVKPWRYTNDMDAFRWTRWRGDKFFTVENDIIHWLLQGPGTRYYQLMEKDPALRDFIAAIGLTNRFIQLDEKKLLEFGQKSPILYPVMALRMDLEDAKKLLQNHPEYHNVRDQLIIKKLQGQAKIDAIDQYVVRYPDYTPADMPKTAVALNTHAELHALAGAELFKMGRPLEAAERWVKGCTAEDMGLVAEQVMTVDQLLTFCQKHFSRPVLAEQRIYSLLCARNGKTLSLDILEPQELSSMMRNLLARRLMRAGRFDEAEKYFTGNLTRIHARKFFALKKCLDFPTVSREKKLTAALNMAALLRFNGDKLFGTFLEPDNLICRNQYPCVWGIEQQYVKLNKENLPRYSYYLQAAEWYAKAAELTDDVTLKGYALWQAGTLLKKHATGTADRYFKKLYAVAPELTANNWFLPPKSVPQALKEFSSRSFFIGGLPLYSRSGAPEKTAVSGDAAPLLPEILSNRLLKENASPRELLETARKTLQESSDITFELLEQIRYTLKTAGDQGLAEADIWNSIIQYRFLLDHEGAYWFLQRAAGRGKMFNLLRHELGHVYSSLGYWQEGVAAIRQVADTENQDLPLLGIAAFNVAVLYYNGQLGLPCDRELAKKYFEQAVKADPRYAGRLSFSERSVPVKGQ